MALTKFDRRVLAEAKKLLAAKKSGVAMDLATSVGKRLNEKPDTVRLSLQKLVTEGELPTNAV